MVEGTGRERGQTGSLDVTNINPSGFREQERERTTTDDRAAVHIRTWIWIQNL